MSVLGFLLAFPVSYRQRVLAKQRPPMSKAQFVESIKETGGDAGVAAVVWDAIVDFGIEPGFSLYPDDDLLKTIGMAEEDLDEDVITATCQSLGRRVPTQDLVDRFGRVDTIRDVVQLIGQCPIGSS